MLKVKKVVRKKVVKKKVVIPRKKQEEFLNFGEDEDAMQAVRRLELSGATQNKLDVDFWLEKAEEMGVSVNEERQSSGV